MNSLRFSLLGVAAAVVWICAIQSERAAIAQAAPACPQKCTKEADCQQACKSVNQVQRFYCFEVVQISNPGKVCEKSTNAGDTCNNNMNVKCGTFRGKTCASSTADCSNTTDGPTDEEMAGCAAGANP